MQLSSKLGVVDQVATQPHTHGPAYGVPCLDDETPFMVFGALLSPCMSPHGTIQQPLQHDLQHVRICTCSACLWRLGLQNSPRTPLPMSDCWMRQLTQHGMALQQLLPQFMMQMTGHEKWRHSFRAGLKSGRAQLPLIHGLP